MRRLINTVRQSFRISVQNIITNKMRSFLTMLGIIIGVAAVIGLITLVQNATSSILGQFSELGAGTLSVSAPGTAMKSGLTDADLQTIMEVPGVRGVSPQVSGATAAVYDARVYENVSVTGRNELYFAYNDVIESGRGLNASEMNGSINVCIIDQDFLKNIFKGGEALGKRVRLNGAEYLVVGVQKKDNSIFAAYSDRSSLDGSVIIPYKNALTMSWSKNVTSLDIYVEDGVSNAEVEERLRETLDKIYNHTENAFQVMNMDSLMDTMNSVSSMLSTMLGGIAGIALVVGGIGIMNMMLVSVSERTKEIGLRKALGAEPSRIQTQFLLEAVILSVFGGMIGVGLGCLIAFVGARLMDTSFAISPSAIALGLGFSAAVGIIFGWAPARRASRLNPIDALRAE
ncbi:MAG: ABC transporter permease [Lachnospiraceae bacterium]|nr:ABC transporter permease [Lachnospiraceae bacterium]